MRVLVIGDPHARTSALADFGRMQTAVMAHCHAAGGQGGYDLVVVTGDLLHDHAYVHTAAYNAVLGFLRELSTVPRLGLYVLIGNHDLISNQVFLEPKHAFNAVKAWPGVQVVDTVVAAHGFVFAPYVPPGRFVEALDTLSLAGGPDWRTARAIFAHQEFKGARNGPHTSQTGDGWDPSSPLVVSGHFHGYQWPRANLCYVGSPMAHDFGDDGEHGLSSLTFTDDGRCVETRVDLGLPGRVTRECAIDEAEAFVPDAGALTRLVVTGDASALLAFRKSAAYGIVRARVAKVVLRATGGLAAAQVRPGATYLSLLEEQLQQEDKLVRAAFAALRDDDPYSLPLTVPTPAPAVYS